MRFRIWLAYVALLTAGLGGATNSVVAEGPGNGTPFVDPGMMSHSNPGLDALNGASVPIGPGGFAPDSLHPYPAISPFENYGEQHRVSNGLWMRDRFGPGKIYSRISATLMTPRQPNRSPITVVGTGAAAGDASGGGFTVINTQAFQDDPDPLDLRDTIQQREKNKSQPSIRGLIGWEQSGGHRFEMNAWYNPGGTAFYRRGLGGPGVAVSPGTTTVNHGLALPNGIVQYDQFFRIQLQSVSGGTGVDFLSNDIWPSQHKAMRIVYGVRFLHIDEEFGFIGRDSALGGFDSELSSRTTSNLIGPQVGLDYEFGGETFKLAGHSKAGVMLNFTNYELSGRGIGDPATNVLFNPNLAFNSSEDHAHLTPLIEQNLRLEMDVVPFIPILRKSHLLRQSKVHIGYSVILGFQIARPMNVILWQNQPNTPILDSNLAALRTQWYTHGWEFGFTSTW